MASVPDAYIIWRHLKGMDTPLATDVGSTPDFMPLSSFEWWRPAGGWIEIAGRPAPSSWDVASSHSFEASLGAHRAADAAAGETAIKGIAPVFENSPPIRYVPHAENPALFMDMLKLEPTLQSLVKFANRWGLPEYEGKTVYFDNVSLAEAAGLQFVERHGRAFLDIYKLAPFLHFLMHFKISIHLYDALGLGLAEVRNVLTKEWPVFEELSIRLASEEKVQKFDENSVMVFARSTIANLINLLHVREGLSVHPYISVEKESGETHLQLRPSSLLGVIVLQFINAFLEDKSFRPCESCRKWMEIASDARSQRKRFCSDACRMRAYRAREVGA